MNFTKTEPNKNKEIIQLKNPMNKNILISNDYHLETSTKAQRRIKPPSSTPNMEDLKYGSFLESKMSPEYLRNYDKESLKNIDNYYINKKENLNVLSRFGNWITLKPDDKNRSHALEKLKHGTYETSIIAPVWMDIATRRKNNKIIKIEITEKEIEKINKTKSHNSIDAIIEDIKKKKNISTMDKSKKDWKAYVEEKQIEKELSHNRKDGFLGKKKFLDETNELVNEQQKLMVKKAKYAYELKQNEKNK